MIKKYSQLKKQAGKYDLPSGDERKELRDKGFEEYRKKMEEVQANRKQLLLRKLIPKGGEVPLLNNPNRKVIVSKDPQDNSKWRITDFIFHNGELLPSGHMICKDLTEGNHLDTVLGSLYGVDWEAWEKKK
jgi:hypothetical protein